uniref:DUF6461 domain-containing protein n=1 Tax=Herbidospora sakaeratensis TaxID=564415 RepID=UPI000782F099|nr:DUF6461 domain-containing protein [Herbidospora sakaeratensis]
MYAELAELLDCKTVAWVKGVSPADVVTRWGGNPAAFSPMTFGEMIDSWWNIYEEEDAFVAVAAVGGWTLVVDSRWIGVDEKIVERLSVGTRVVSHSLLEVKGLHEWRWAEDGHLRIGFYAQEGFMADDLHVDPQEFPELVAPMARIDAEFPDWFEIDEGPVFALTESLTGITLTPRMLTELAFQGYYLSDPTT